MAALLELRNNRTQRIAVLQIRERGNCKGIVGEDFEPRLDTPKKLKPRIEHAIEDASNAEPSVQDDHIARAYVLIRSWCETFVEQELLGNVAQRYRPNIMIGSLGSIKSDRIDDAISVVTRVFNRSSRYIDGHSNPLELQNVVPSIEDLQEDWKTLQEARDDYVKQ